jgi:Rrf2 family protein
MRLTVTRRTGIALVVLRHLAAVTTRASTTELAVAAGTTVSFLPKVMLPLVRRGWVTSVAGPGGGYQAAPGLEHLSVLDVVEAVDGPIDTSGCLLPASQGSCPFHPRWEHAKRALLHELAELHVTEGLDPPALHTTALPSGLQKGTTQ